MGKTLDSAKISLDSAEISTRSENAAQHKQMEICYNEAMQSDEIFKENGIFPPTSSGNDAAGRQRKNANMKTEWMLLIYDALIGGQSVARIEFCCRHAISERTFYRYMREISSFLRKYKPGYKVEVLEPEGKYFMKNTEKR
ncbi:MAG TPA: hypothetical protein IAB32_03530 [Candidatus Scatosoma pullicola]|nr:hypothetical protein [Candidatus Scatosoma pullicola]